MGQAIVITNSQQRTLLKYMGKEFSLRDVQQQILDKKCELNATLRSYVLELYEKDTHISLSDISRINKM